MHVSEVVTLGVDGVGVCVGVDVDEGGWGVVFVAVVDYASNV